MKVRDILHSRLIFVSGKGGVGKNCVSAALGKSAAQAGKKVLLVEVDNFHASFPSIFDRNHWYEPCELEPNLYGCNITWMKALEDWLSEYCTHSNNCTSHFKESCGDAIFECDTWC